MNKVSDNLYQLHEKINHIIDDLGLNKNSVNLLCVSKTKPEELVIEAYKNGERNFGENYAVEGANKIISLKEKGYNDIIWHFIGPMQKNKTKLIAENFNICESVDREIIAKRLNDQRPDNLPPLKVLIQVNISEEEQKSGCKPEEVEALVKAIKSYPYLKFFGFMGVAKDTDNIHEIENSFNLLKNLYEKYKNNYGDDGILSMGMTHDMECAIKCGSNQLRIGTAIFGAREYKNK